MAKLLLVILLFLAFAAQGQQLQRIAIMGTEDDGNPSVGILEQMHLTDKLREIAGGILPKDKYIIMTQQSIVDKLGSFEQAVKICRESTCLVDLGRKVSADYIAQARLGRFGENVTIKVELYGVARGNLVASFTDDAKDVQGLRSILEARSPDLFKKMPGVVPEPPPPPPPVAEPVVFEPVYEYVEEEEKESVVQEGVRFGIRAGFNVNDFSFGYRELDGETSAGMSLGAGLVLNVPLASQVSLNMGLDFYYRELFSRESEMGSESLNEFAISIPVLLRVAFVENGFLHLVAGVQMDIPIETKWEYYYDYFSSHRSGVDFGIVFGLAYMAGPSVGVDFRCIIGLTGLFENFEDSRIVYDGSNRYKDNSSLRQYGLGVVYLF